MNVYAADRKRMEELFWKNVFAVDSLGFREALAKYAERARQDLEEAKAYFSTAAPCSADKEEDRFMARAMAGMLAKVLGQRLEVLDGMLQPATLNNRSWRSWKE